MLKKNVYVSFDEKDRKYYEKVISWNKNPYLGFNFIEAPASDFSSPFFVKIKNNIMSKLAQSSVTLVIVGEGANDASPDCLEIGALNWQSFEIVKSLARGNKLVAVKTDEDLAAPVAMRGADVVWAQAFTLDAVMSALGKA